MWGWDDSFKYFSAPILPGVNGTNIIKVKIPAVNIHLDKYYHPNRSFPHGDIYENWILFGFDMYSFTIISDQQHPMIWEETKRIGNTTKRNWVWTNDTSTEHWYYPDDPFFKYNIIQPYPTYKPSQKW